MNLKQNRKVHSEECCTNYNLFCLLVLLYELSRPWNSFLYTFNFRLNQTTHCLLLRDLRVSQSKKERYESNRSECSDRMSYLPVKQCVCLSLHMLLVSDNYKGGWDLSYFAIASLSKTTYPTIN